MNRPIFLILGIWFAVASCVGAATASGLPVYPGATKVTSPVGTTFLRCGHKISVTSYDAHADPRAVTDWHSARIPGGIRVTKNNVAGLAMIEISSQMAWALPPSCSLMASAPSVSA